ncbi:MAG: hypothetical protein HKN20_08995 [Gemmatimonadetes bacterium]|nr:hypothetical protein [Gemmatimonadota bacterium]
MRPIRIIIPLLLLSLTLGCGENRFVNGPVVPSLLYSPGPVAPGEPFTLGVHFAIAPEWHLYWNGKNDSGSPMTFTVLEAPEGATLGDAEWPAPVRYVSPGNIVDHVYFDETMLRVPGMLPDPLPAGADTLVFRLALEWVVCHEVCEFGADEVVVRVPVGESRGVPREAAGAFRRLAGRYPVPLADTEARISWDGGRMIVRDEDAASIVFYPAETSSPFAPPYQDERLEEPALVVPFETEGTDIRAAGVLVWEGRNRPPARIDSRPSSERDTQ